MEKKRNYFELNEKNDQVFEPTDDELMSLESDLIEEEEDAQEDAAGECAGEESGRGEKGRKKKASEKEALRTSMQQYLFEIANIPLLNAEEELKLGKIIAEGGKQSKDAQNRLVEANLRLVVHESKRFMGSGLPLEELNSLGVFGLLRAAEKFDYQKGFKFSTYAVWWIRQSISRGVNEEKSPVHIPVHVQTTMNKIRRAQKELTQEYHREPTVVELSNYLKLPYEKVSIALHAMLPAVYMDTPIGDEEESRLGNFIPDENAKDPSSDLVEQDLKDAIRQVIGKLDEKERFVIMHRFGIGCNGQMSLDKIGKMPEMNVSRERVRQIEERALNKIRRSASAMKALAPFTEIAS